MAVTHVTHTVAGFSAINYALSGKPHVTDKYVSGRVLTASGVNCTVHGCRTQMNAVWKRYGINRPTKHKRRQAQRVIQSFDPEQLDYRKPEDIRKANAIGVRTARKLYPHRQSIVVTQSDTEHHVLHNHIITNMLDFRTGHSMNGKYTSWRHVQTVSDDIVRSYGLNPEAHKYMITTSHGRVPAGYIHETNAEYHLRKSGRYSWVQDVRNRVRSAMDSSASWSELITKCRQQGVICDPFRKHRGGVRRDKNGDPVLKTHTSYRFTDKNGKSHRIRDKKLGTIFTHPYAVQQFQYITYVRQKRQKSSLERQSANVSLVNQQKAKASEKTSMRALSASVSISISASVSARTSASTSISLSQSADPVKQRNQSASEAYSSVATSFSDEISVISQQSIKALSKAQNIRTDSKAGASLLEYRAYNQQRSVVGERESKRINQIMPKFSSRKAQRYAWWYYRSAIPAKVVRYDGNIPVFSINFHDRKWLHQLGDPIIRGFRNGERWTLDKWRAGKQAITKWVHQAKIKLGYDVEKYADLNLDGYRPYSLTELARQAVIGRIVGVHRAKIFTTDIHSISDKFQNFIQPVYSWTTNIKRNASSASSASTSASSARYEAISQANVSANTATSLAILNRNTDNNSIRRESASASYASWANTSSGSASIASSVASSSVAMSLLSASVSTSVSQWTSSAYGLTYFDWLDARSLAITNGNWGSLSSLASIGNHKQRKFSGAYGYKQKPQAVNFNQYSSLADTCKSASQSVSHSLYLSRHRGPDWTL